jgi:hypothetical protein
MDFQCIIYLGASVLFVGTFLLLVGIAYGAYRYVSDPLARAAAHKTLQENPGQWASALLVFVCLIAVVWLIASSGPSPTQAGIAPSSQTDRSWSMVLKDKIFHTKKFFIKHLGTHPKST